MDICSKKVNIGYGWKVLLCINQSTTITSKLLLANWWNTGMYYSYKGRGILDTHLSSILWANCVFNSSIRTLSTSCSRNRTRWRKYAEYIYIPWWSLWDYWNINNCEAFVHQTRQCTYAVCIFVETCERLTNSNMMQAEERKGLTCFSFILTGN